MTATPRPERTVVSRFRRDLYNQPAKYGEPPWHIAVEPYSRKDVGYQRHYAALCGYTYDAILGGIMVSNAKSRPAGPHCKVCIRRAAQSAAGQEDTP